MTSSASEISSSLPTPGHEVIEDIASGVNFHRRGLITLLERAIKGGVQEVVVAHRDRLCRIAFELIKAALRACRCRLVVLDAEVGPENAEGDATELQEDLMPIVSYFVTSHTGKRAAQNRRRRAQAAATATSSGEKESEESSDEEVDSGPDSSSGSQAL